MNLVLLWALPVPTVGSRSFALAKHARFTNYTAHCIQYHIGKLSKRAVTSLDET
jgi:hypothetical protein